MDYPTLDAHAHVAFKGSLEDLKSSGAVLAMTLSLEEAGVAAGGRRDWIIWGAGCHPRFPPAQRAFDIGRFRELIEETAIVGEIGLDTGSRVPLEVQMRNFRQILKVVARTPRLTSIHSYRATELVLQELRRTPIDVPILHWWTGSAEETSEAVKLGCYFSVHSQVARQSKFRTRVPQERILVESDHGYNDPPAAIPCRIQWVEFLVAQQLKVTVEEVRRLVWRNMAAITSQAQIMNLFPEPFAALLSAAKAETTVLPTQAALPGLKESPSRMGG